MMTSLVSVVGHQLVGGRQLTERGAPPLVARQPAFGLPQRFRQTAPQFICLRRDRRREPPHRAAHQQQQHQRDDGKRPIFAKSGAAA